MYERFRLNHPTKGSPAMDFGQHIMEKLATTSWYVVPPETLREFFGAEFEINRLNEIAKSLAEKFSVVTGVKTYANADSGEVLHSIMLVARDTESYYEGREEYTRQFLETNDRNVVQDVLLDAEKMEAFYQATVCHLEEHEYGGVAMHDLTDQECIQHAQFVQKQGIICVPFKLEADLPTGETFTRRMIVTARDEQIKNTVITNLQEAAKMGPLPTRFIFLLN